MKKYLFVLISLFLCDAAFSQSEFKDGFIISNTNDTIFGKINMMSNYRNSKTCEFIQNDSETTQSYSPGDIKGYRIEGLKYYVSKEIPLQNKKTLVFLEFLVQGIVNLYYYRDPLFEHYFIEKNGNLILLSNENKTLLTDGGVEYTTQSNQYKGALNYAFQDSKEFQKIVNKTNFSYNSLISGTKAYHNSVCDEYSCIDYTRSTKLILFFEPVAGFIMSDFRYKTSSDKVFDYQPVIGANIRYISNRFRNLWSFSTGLHYSRNNYFGEFANSMFTSNDLFGISMKYSILRLPLMLEYTMNTKKIQPFVYLGYVFSIQLNVEKKLTDVYYDYAFETRTEYPKTIKTYENTNSGYIAGAGLKYQRDANSYYFLKAHYEKRNPISRFNRVLDYHYGHAYTVSLGYGFFLGK
jgi:hypothetical protein